MAWKHQLSDIYSHFPALWLSDVQRLTRKHANLLAYLLPTGTGVLRTKRHLVHWCTSLAIMWKRLMASFVFYLWKRYHLSGTLSTMEISQTTAQRFLGRTGLAYCGR